MPVQVLSDARYSRLRIKNMSKRAGDMAPVWPRVERLVRSEVRKQFLSGGTYFGNQPGLANQVRGPWKPLRPATIAAKGSAKPLIRTGALMREFTGSPMQHVQVNRRSAHFGSQSSKAIWMSRGTRRNGERVVPPRPILYPNPRLNQEISKVIAKYVLGRKPQVI